MFGLIVTKELKAIILSPKFYATFLVCTILIMLSLFVGIKEYNGAVAQYQTAIQLTQQQVEEAGSWWEVDNRAYRAPDPMQIFVAGVNNDIGRFSDITWRTSEAKLQSSSYAEDTLFAVFRFIDFTFIVQVVLSLFAILFTYDTINGERESGTLKLALSNSVPKAQFLLAKFVGSWLGLTIPLLIPILIGILVVMLFQVPMSGAEWGRFGTLIGISILYFTFFIAFGILVSSLVKRSSVSFLILLVSWVTLVLIVPRAATMAAQQLVEVPSVAEVESQKDRYAQDQRDTMWKMRREQFAARRAEVDALPEEDQEAYRNARQALWDEEDDAIRQDYSDAVAEHQRTLNEDLNNRKSRQEDMAFSLSRLSPASAYQIAAMNLAGTSTKLKKRYEESMKTYSETFASFVNEKQDAERKRNNSRRSRSMSDEELDVSELPRFSPPEVTFKDTAGPTIVDTGLLSIFTILAFAASFIAFVRYDVR